MKIFVLIVGAMLLVTGCEPQDKKEQNAPVQAEEPQALTPRHIRNTDTAASPSPEGELGIEGHVWNAEDIGGKGVIDNSNVILSLNGGEASGKTGCNSYRGGYTIKGSEIKFGHIMSSRMACAAEAMANQERDYTELLSKVTSFQNGADGSLVLTTSDGKTIRFIRQ